MLNRLPLRLFLTGLVALYIGERAFESAARVAVSASAVLLIMAAIAVAGVRYARSQGERRSAHGRVLIDYGVCLVALLMYAAQLPELAWIDGASDAHTLVVVAWPAILLLGLVPAVAMELSIGGMVLTPRLELWRVGLAARAARIVALAVIGFAGLNFAAAKWNHKVDLSYFKTAQPGTSTLALVKGLTKPVDVILFFPPGNEVAEEARAYLDELAGVSGQLKVQVLDQARSPTLAKEMQVRSNGFLALRSGDKSKTIRLGLDIESARKQLRDLDAEVQQNLIEVVRPPRVAYLTTGHMERDFDPSSDDKRLSLSEFRTLLTSLGFQTKRLGLGDGLGTDVPEDASVLVIAGPTEPFLDAERAAIRRYLERGGRLLAAIDPDHGTTEDPLLATLGVRVTSALVGSRRFLVRVEGQGESPYNLVTTRTKSHPATTTLDRANGRLGVVLLGAGTVEKTEVNPAGLKSTFVLEAMRDSWLDRNGDRTENKGQESTRNLAFAVAIEGNLGGPAVDSAENSASATKKEGSMDLSAGTAMRGVILSDADVLGTGIVRTPGNAYFVADTLRWLVGDEETAGEVQSEKDIPVVHRKEEDRIWFYGTSFLFPTAILLGGLLFTNRGGRRRRRG